MILGDDNFLDTTPKETTHKLSFIKNKNFCSMKDTVKRIRRQTTDYKEILAKDTSMKDYYTKYIRKS